MEKAPDQWPIAPTSQAGREPQDPVRDQAPLARALATILDDAVTIPGTNIKVGLDVLIGLIPGVGDTTSTALSGVILLSAVKNRVPIPVLLRMGLNMFLDWLIGLIPGVGDVADALFRANRKNMVLLEKTLERPAHERKMSVAYLVGALTVAILIIVSLIAATLGSLWLMWTLLTSGMKFK